MFSNSTSRSIGRAERTRRAAAWILATAGIALLSLVLSPLRTTFGLPGGLLCLLLAVVVVATIGGVPQAVVATVVAALGADYFFTQPIHSLRVHRAADGVALGVFFAVAAAISALVERSSRHRAQVARAQARSDALGQLDSVRTALLAAVSHDLRTPLHAIKVAATSMLADEVTWSSEQIREFATTIDAETDRLTALVDDLLDMSRLQTGALPVTARVVSVQGVLDAALASVPTSGPPIVLDVAGSLPALEVDPGLLERAVANVLANAQRFSPSDSPTRVRARLAADRPDGADRVEICVIDRGPGVPAAQREQVFKPFQRLGDRPSVGHDGLGLGLAIARGFVEAMGGELDLRETPGGGATFVFSLPTVPRDRRQSQGEVDGATGVPAGEGRRASLAHGPAAGGSAGGPLAQTHGLVIDLAAHIVTLDGEEVHLTTTEFALLRALATSRGPVSYQALARIVWGSLRSDVRPRVRTHMNRLRAKLGGDRRELIRTKVGFGYRLG